MKYKALRPSPAALDSLQRRLKQVQRPLRKSLASPEQVLGKSCLSPPPDLLPLLPHRLGQAPLPLHPRPRLGPPRGARGGRGVGDSRAARVHGVRV